MKILSNQEINNLINENNILRMELNELVSKEQSAITRVAKLENENFRMREEYKTLQNRETEFNRQISQLNQQNNNLLLQIDSVNRVKNKMRDDILGVIDQNELMPQ